MRGTIKWGNKKERKFNKWSRSKVITLKDGKVGKEEGKWEERRKVGKEETVEEK